MIRSIPSTSQDRREMFGTDDYCEIVQRINASAMDGILFDSRDAGHAVKSRKSLEGMLSESSLREAIPLAGKPVLFGGGITGDNVKKLIRGYHPDYIDVMTGIEDEPGVKNPEKLKSLAAEMGWQV